MAGSLISLASRVVVPVPCEWLQPNPSVSELLVKAWPPRVSLLSDGGVLLDANPLCKRLLLLLLAPPSAPPSALPFLFYILLALASFLRSFAKRISFLRSLQARNESREDSRNGNIRSNPSLVSLALGPEDPGPEPSPNPYAKSLPASLCSDFLGDLTSPVLFDPLVAAAAAPPLVNPLAPSAAACGMPPCRLDTTALRQVLGASLAGDNTPGSRGEVLIFPCSGAASAACSRSESGDC